MNIPERPANGKGLLIAAVLLIAIATLTPTGEKEAPVCMLCADRGVADFLANIILFLPLGFALARASRRFIRAAAFAVLFSLLIELAQLFIIAGRHANVGDLVANGMGGMLGWWLGSHRHWWLGYDGNQDTRCWVVLSATLAVLIGGLLLFTPSFPASQYYMQWTAELGYMSHYDGRVLAARLGPLELPPGTITDSDSVARLLLEQPLELVAVAALPPWIAPIVSIYDDQSRQIMLLGADRADLVFRHRVIADELKLDRGDFRLHQAFEEFPPGTPYRLVWTVDQRGYCLELDGKRDCGPGFTVGDTWTLMLALDWGTDERAVLRFLWLAFLFVPAGVFARRLSTLFGAVAVVVAVLVVVPFLLGFATTPPYQIAGATVGLVAGRRLGRRAAARAAGAQASIRPSVTAIGRNR